MAASRVHRPSVNPARPIVVVEEHHEVLPYWFAEHGAQPLALLHIDAHPDLETPPGHPLLRRAMAPSNNSTDELSAVRSLMSGNDVQIVGAIALGLLDTVIWVRPEWDEPTRPQWHHRTKERLQLLRVGWAATEACAGRPCICSCATSARQNVSAERLLHETPPHSPLAAETWIARFGDASSESCTARLSTERADDEEIDLEPSNCHVRHAAVMMALPERRAVGVLRMWTRTWVRRLDAAPGEGAGAAAAVVADAPEAAPLRLHQPLILDIDYDFFGVEERVHWMLSRTRARVGVGEEDVARVALLLHSLFGDDLQTAHEASAHQIAICLLRRGSSTGSGGGGALGESVLSTAKCLARLANCSWGGVPATAAAGSAQRQCADRATELASMAMWEVRAVQDFISTHGFCLSSSPASAPPIHRPYLRLCIPGDPDPDDAAAEDAVEPTADWNATASNSIEADGAVVARRVARLGALLDALSGPSPAVTTLCRSVRDGYLPRSFAAGIEDGVLHLLRRRFELPTTAVHFDGNLLGGADGWARHEAAVRCTPRHDGPALPLLEQAAAEAGRASAADSQECVAAVVAEHRRRVPWQAAPQEIEAYARADFYAHQRTASLSATRVAPGPVPLVVVVMLLISAAVVYVLVHVWIVRLRWPRRLRRQCALIQNATVGAKGTCKRTE